MRGVLAPFTVALAAGVSLLSLVTPTAALQFDYYSAYCDGVYTKLIVSEEERRSTAGLQFVLTAGNTSSYPPVWTANAEWSELNFVSGIYTARANLTGRYNATWLGDPSLGVNSKNYPLFGSPRNLYVTLLTQVQPPLYLNLTNTTIPNQISGLISYFSCEPQMCPDGTYKVPQGIYYDCSSHGGVDTKPGKSSESFPTQGQLAGIFIGSIVGLVILLFGLCRLRKRYKMRGSLRSNVDIHDRRYTEQHYHPPVVSAPMRAKTAESPIGREERGIPALYRRNSLGLSSHDEDDDDLEMEEEEAGRDDRTGQAQTSNVAQAETFFRAPADPMDGVAVPPPAYSPNDPQDQAKPQTAPSAATAPAPASTPAAAPAAPESTVGPSSGTNGDEQQRTTPSTIAP